MLADNKEFLKFGDVIYLNSKSTVDISLKSLENSYPADAYKPNAQHPNNNVLQGYLAAKGFLDEKIILPQDPHRSEFTRARHAEPAQRQRLPLCRRAKVEA
jgi:hypothetical protein